MPNFSIALTGLQADTVSLNTIGNNLANLNTTAFKTQSTNFEDLFYQNIGTSGSGDTLQIGVGTRASSTSSNFTQGSITTTNVATDMAVNGAGFFVVQKGSTQMITRAGDFQLSSTGALVDTTGDSVMGYGVVNGAVDVNGGLKPMVLPVSANQAASATANFSLSTSLNASAATGTTFTSPVTMYDSLGTAHSADVTFTKTSNTTWTYGIALPAGDATGTPSANAAGTLTFNSSGALISPAADVTGISFPGLVDGASNLNVNFNLYDSNGSPVIAQTSGTSNTSSTTQDGYAGGSYQNFAVDGTGLVTATFSNGQTSKVGQIAEASVINTDGLTRAGSNDYSPTEASGPISIGLAGVGGRGQIEGQSLESSNVDISGEFSNLIVAQRAFEANSKTVTTFDTVTQEAIGMIR